MTTRQYKLTPFICRRKYLVGLIFVIEGDGREFFHNENFPIYGNDNFVQTKITLIVFFVYNDESMSKYHKLQKKKRA